MRNKASLGNRLKNLINEKMSITDFAYKIGYPVKIVYAWCLDEIWIKDEDKIKIAQALDMSKSELEKKLEK